MGNFSHFARWEFFPAGLFSHGKKFLWDFSKMVSVSQMSCNCDLDSIICILMWTTWPMQCNSVCVCVWRGGGGWGRSSLVAVLLI